MGFLLPLVFVSCYAGMLLLLTRSLGIGYGLVTYVLLVGLLTCFGGWLLKGSDVGRVSWRNRVAGFCLPWTGWVGGGTLSQLLIKNGLAGFIFGVAVLGIERTNWFPATVSASADPPSIYDWGLLVATWICWLSLLGAWLWMLKTFLTRHSDVRSVLNRQRSVWLPILIPPLAIAASIACRTMGFAWWGLGVVAAPLLYVLLPVLLIIAVMLWHVLSGKPMRWN